MIRKFLKDIRGNYMIVTAVAIAPIMGAVALAVDFTEMNRERQAMLNALDAANLAAARQLQAGATEADVLAYTRKFFDINLGPVDPAATTLTTILPSNNIGGGTLKSTGCLNYKPYFYPVFAMLLNGTQSSQAIAFCATSEVRLKNTLEVALVLDNSGSMDFIGTGSGKKRLELLKTASKQLVDTIAKQAAMMKQVSKPVQFGIVPFAASVNVGPDKAGEAWMDSNGLSPVHHENFDWTTLNAPNKSAEFSGGMWYKKGSEWGDQEGQPLTRFSLYADMKKVSSREWVSTGREWVCDEYRSNKTCRRGHWVETGYWDETISEYASWQGCVESRPYPYNIQDTGATTTEPATLFVPMFGPDEPGDIWKTSTDGYLDDENYNGGNANWNNWWNDGIETGTGVTNMRARQKNMAKYFEVRPYDAVSEKGTGPNYSCATMPITPLEDVTTSAGINKIKGAIDAMVANGATNVPEGMAWGWRVVSGGAPFTEGRPDTERGNDKVVIVLTDGANTYYTPGSLGAQDMAGNKSTYSAYGYTGYGYNGTGTTRLFMGTSSDIGKSDYSNANYTKAMNEHFAELCVNAKGANIIVMTVALDLSTSKTDEKGQIDALKACASDSRYRKDPSDPSKPAKLFWNTTGGELEKTFKEIADELSNLRIVS